MRDAFNSGFLSFLDRATSPFHAVDAMAERLRAAGFTALSVADDWDLAPGSACYVVRNDSSIVAFRVGSKLGVESGMRMAGAHTDSPCLMVKPNPEKSSQGYQQLGVEVYGGALLNPWFDRDLSLAGRVSFLNSESVLCKQLVDFRRPLAVIPSLAIHLDREVNQKRAINPQRHILPVLGLGDKLDLRALLAQQISAEHPTVQVSQVLDYELCFYDTQAPMLTGINREFICGARLDNLLSCYAGLQAIIAADGAASSLLVCNDHEEVGSLSAAGAQGPMLRQLLERLAGNPAAYARMIDNSLMISTDNAHGVHPNFADRHDENHGPVLNGGPVIKINANQRYATNSETSARFRQLCAEAGVPVQTFVVRTDMACGSTIGPITAGEIGVRTLDVGAPQFAMHSVREMAGSEDACNLSHVLTTFMNSQAPLNPQPL